MNYKALALILSATSLFYFSRKKKKEEPPKKRKIITPHVKNELIVFFKDLGEKRQEEAKELQTQLIFKLEEAGGRQIAACGKCDGLLTLWKFDNLQEVDLDAVAENQRSGSVSTVKAGNEDIAYLQLNFITELPNDEKCSKWKGLKLKEKQKGNGPLIAVLDTGIDTTSFPKQHLWNYDNDSPEPCFEKHDYGHDFVNGGSVMDDDPGRHGTLINAYILEQFKDKDTSPKLMNIKVLDKDGRGTYYNFICGVLFAKSHGAHIINSSLGYYDYDRVSGSNVDLDYLLNSLLKDNGTLFVSAAGNLTDDTQFLNQNTGGNPRNLEDHRFNFASINDTSECALSNIIAVTTVDVDVPEVSPTQNYSTRHIDLGVQADKIDDIPYKFKLPFPELNSGPPISGSSYATAIATGRIGSTLPMNYYSGRTTKKDIIEPIRDHTRFEMHNSGLQQYVYQGRYIKR